MNARVAETRPTGFLRLAFERDARGTRLERNDARAPLRAHRAFALPGGEALAQLVQVGPGLLAGDRLELEVAVGPGAAAVLVAQSATKIHRMRPGERAAQTVRIRVAAGGRFEVHPGLLIPFAGSAFEQRVEIDLEPGATLVWTERWSTGRGRTPEPEAFRRLASRLRLRVGGELRYADALELTGADARARGRLDGRRCLATALLVGGPAPEARAGHDGVALGAFDPAIGGHYLRALGDDAFALRRTVERVVAEQRAAEGRTALDYGRYGS